LGFFQLLVNLFQFNRTNWKAVMLCFLTATVFWFFNSLNKTHTTNIHFPVRFEYDDQKYLPADALPQQVTLNISGNGWDLFRKYFGLKVPTLVIHLDKPEVKQIAGASLQATLGSQLANLQINFVVTDSLHLYLDEKISKKFKIAADVSGISYKKGFGRISPVVILPDSVELIGPKSLLKKMPDFILLKLIEKRVDENLREQAEIVLPSSEYITRNPPVVEVMFEVGEMMEATKWVRIKAENMPWGAEVVKDSVQVLFVFPQKNKDLFDDMKLSALVNPGDLKKGESKHFQPLVEGLPAWVQIAKIDSVLAKRY
jgi:hypothetical protein